MKHPTIDLPEAEKIIQKLLPGHEKSAILKFEELDHKGYSYIAGLRSYLLECSNADNNEPSHCFITISHPSPNKGIYHHNSLPVIHELLNRMHSRTDIPTVKSILDTSLDNVPYNILLFPGLRLCAPDVIPLSEAKKSGVLSAEDTMRIDLTLGKFFGELHSGVQNDWFGLHELSEPTDPSYDWQSVFTSLFETLLDRLESQSYSLPYHAIRSYLSRSIGHFLFDDVDVPSLIWFTGTEDDVFITIPSASSQDVPTIAAILPNITHALWGDPLLESFFLPPISTALMEGYVASGGNPIMVFPRHKTKRMWYTFFLALVVLEEVGEDKDEALEKQRLWAEETIKHCIDTLEHSPNY